MKRNIGKNLLKATLATLGLMTSTFLDAADPCGNFSEPTGGKTVTENGIVDIGNGFNYELWRDGNSGSMTYFGGDYDCAFKANWNYSGDFLARVGYYYGGGNTKTHSDIGDIHAEMNFTKDGNAGGYSFIGIYGWTNDPQIEYYIVEDSYNGHGIPSGTHEITKYQLDGDTYTLYTGTRYDKPSITGNSTFTQIFAVRSTYRNCGHVSVSEHFKNWEKNGIKLGGLYDCKILVEAGGGSGNIIFKYATMYIGEPEPEVPQSPFKGAIELPGKVEMENYDLGGRNNAYYDTDTKNEGGFYREDGVDIVEANGNYAIGYTTKDEWLEYTINVKEAGSYNVEAFAANGNTDINIDLYVDGKKSASLSGESTGDWDIYEKVKGKINLPAGEHILRVKFESNYNNIDYIRFYTGEEEQEEQGEQGGSDPVTPVSSDLTFFDKNGAYFGPSCDDNAPSYGGAYYTGDYTSPFKTVLGKSDEEIQKKLDQMWNHYFNTQEKSNSTVYYEDGQGGAYILDISHNDVRSEGMSYGMMICVQTDHKQEFDKIWNWTKKYMWHKGDKWDGFFRWQCDPSGKEIDGNCAPDGEMYFITALLLAANRWNEKAYFDDAQYILSRMWKGNGKSLFNEQYNVVTFQPINCTDFSDPSYDLPAFLELFSRWSTSNKDKWTNVITPTRNHLVKSCNQYSGLFSDYNHYDGSPYNPWNGGTDRYLYDAMRCAMNYGMDYYLFGKDTKNQEDMAKRIIDHFEKDKYTHGHFNWDGTNGSEGYTLGETGANAVACYALLNNSAYESKVKTNLSKAWNADLATGQYRYYDGLVHYLAMLHLCGSFKIYKPKPSIEEKTVTGNGTVEYLGKTYNQTTTITSFEDCKLYSVLIDVTPTEVEENTISDITIVPNPSTGRFTVNCDENVEMIEIINVLGKMVYSQQGDNTVDTKLEAGVYAVKIFTESGKCVVKKMIVK